MGLSNPTSGTPTALWALVATLGLGGAGLLGYGLTRPVPVQNLADPMPMANRSTESVRPRWARSEPSERRRLADAKNAQRKTECSNRHHDCAIACDQYPKNTSGRAECMSYCDRSEEACASWAHR